MRVIGTAGHVDHGKSTLVRKLTGMDPDRLAEEKAREMTIDLGFAWLRLADGETVGIVDVPGHRDFIENMLAGVGGIDAVLLVIAADEGPMPQTREHLAILDLLGIENGIIVLSKIDMVEDEEWLDLVEQDVRDFLQGSALENAPLIRVSAHRGDGLDDLLEHLAALLNRLSPRINARQPRLPIDRVFSISGFGTVVTGTLSGGILSVGDEVELQPIGRKARIRGLQSYKQAVEAALPGSRTAVNLTGIDKNEIERGFVLTHPGQLRSTILVDAYFRHLRDAPRPLRHHTQVKFFSGAMETLAHVRLLNDETLVPGAEGWIQLRLESAVALTRDDRFILRYPSPAETIGGGVIINPHPGRRWRRFRPEVIADLETRLQGTPEERIAQAAGGTEPVKLAHLQKMTGYSDADLHQAIENAIQQHQLRRLIDGTFLSEEAIQGIFNRMKQLVGAFHQSEPLRGGMPREELRSQIGVKNSFLTMLLEMESGLIAENSLIRLPHHQIRFSEKQQQAVSTLLEKMGENPYAPPSYTEAAALTGEKVLRALIEIGQIVQVQPDVILLREVYEEMTAAALEMIELEGRVTAKSLRDRFDTSRKYAIGLLEYLDNIGVTRRVGDDRVKGTAKGIK